MSTSDNKPFPEKKSPSLRIDCACAWLDRGAALVALGEGDKRPIQKGWIDAPIKTRAEVEKLFAERPKANFGIITGAISSLIVVDVDGPKGEASLKALEAVHGPILATVTVITARGRHLYLRHSGGRIPNSAGKLGSGLDIRGDGGYVVGVGSVHPSGVVYRYADGLSPKLVAIADLPVWLLAKLTAPTRETSTAAPPTIPPEILERARRYAEAVKRAEFERLAKASDGQRNSTLNLCAFALGQLLPHGLLDEREITRQLTAIAVQIGLEPAEIGPTIQSGLTAGQRCPRDLSRLGTPASGAPESTGEPEGAASDITRDLASYGQTDADNAHRLAKRSEYRLIFVPGIGFLVWNGRHWTPDTACQRYQLAEDTARRIAAEADYLPQDLGLSRIAFGKFSLNKLPLERMLELAKPHLAVEVAQLDAAPFLLSVQNGTVDLRTGLLQQHDPRDLITRMVPVAFDPTAKCPRWKAFLKEVCGGDQDLIRYLRRAVGYTLTDNTNEQAFFLINGPGGTGKGVFVNTIREMLGELGQNTPFATFLAKHFEPIPADLAALKGARMVVASESNPNQQIDEAKIKAFTGGDPITARFLYQNFFTFKPTGKLWLVTNDLPQVRSTSDAFWRRARVIPFAIKVAKRRVDKQLGEKLRAELPGILAWAVRGCLAWQKHGLGTCAAVKAATKTWREGADHLGRFVRDCLVLDGKGKISSSEMFGRYQAWCADHGEQALSIKALKVRLTEFDLTHKRVSDGSEWRGARFRRT